MIDHQDPIVRAEMIAVATNRSLETVAKLARLGKMPPRDVHIDGKSRGWLLSTITAWNPRLGRQLDGLLKSPYLPAA